MEEHRKAHPIVPTFPYRYDEEWIEYNMLDDLYASVQNIDEYHIFVFSLSQEKDLLSQWRGYCPHGNGYSIGFETSYFSSYMTDHGLRFVKCEYDGDVQEGMINNFVNSYVDDVSNDGKDLSKLRDSRIDLIRKYINKFQLIASTIKNNPFEDEREWRLVTKPLGPNPIIKFREGTSTIIPYIPIDITRTKHFPVTQIIIGPTSHKQLAKKAIDSLLSCRDIESCNVDASKISYRVS